MTMTDDPLYIVRRLSPERPYYASGRGWTHRLALACRYTDRSQAKRAAATLSADLKEPVEVRRLKSRAVHTTEAPS